MLFPLRLSAQKLSFYRASSSSETLEDVRNKTFVEFEEKVNKGFENGVYWIKVENTSEAIVCELTSAHLKDVQCYVDGLEHSLVLGTLFPTFSLAANKTAFMKISCEMEAFIPFKLSKSNEFNKVENRRLLYSGLYYGFALMVLIINLFYFFSLKEKSFLYYSVFLFFISLAMFQRDGFVGLLLGEDFNLSYFEILTHFLGGVAGSVFAIDYLNMESYWKRYKAIVYSINALAFIIMVVYMTTGLFFWLMVADFVVISILTLIWISGVILFRQNTYSKIFVIAYVFVLIMAFDFFISPLMGWANIGITTKYMKIAGILEMLLLSYAVVYRMKVLHQEYILKERQLYNYTKELHSLEEELQKLNEGKENDITADILSAREVQILELIGAGKINKEIAEELYISVNTVKYHTKKLYAKLNIKSRNEIQPGFVESLN